MEATTQDRWNVPFHPGTGNRADDVGEALDWIAYVLDECGEKVLVHCNAGRSRSVVIVAAYRVERRGMTPADAIALIKRKRDIYLEGGIEDFHLPRPVLRGEEQRWPR